MNEKEFLKLINSKKNKNNEKTFFAINDLLRGDKQDGMIPYKKSFFSRIFRSKQKSIKTADQIIMDNFEVILSKLDFYNSPQNTMRMLLKRDELRPFLDENFLKILEIVKRDVDKDNEENPKTLQYNTLHLIDDFLEENPNGKDFIVKYAEKIIENTPKKYLFNVIQLLKGKDELIDEFLNNTLEQNKVDIARELILDSIRLKDRDTSDYYKEQASNDYAVTLSIMIDEVLNSEGKKWIDLDSNLGGSYSDVFMTGEKIIKVGIPRKTYKMPYTRRILQPLVRTNFDVGGRDFACVEICNKVDLEFEGDGEEIIYEIYKELRENGIIWTDPKRDNIGRLKADNIAYLNGEAMEVDSSSVGFEEETQEEPLKKGEFVIIDTDYIFREDDPELFWGNKEYGLYLERKYQQEKQEEIAKKFRENTRGTEKRRGKYSRTEQRCLKNKMENRNKIIINNVIKHKN